MTKRAAIRVRRSAITTPVTSCWSARLPDGYMRVGISRGPPRGQRGYRLYRPLMPGPWFKSVTPATYRRLYMAQLAKLDAREVLRALAALAGDKVPALLCFEEPGGRWCHRGLVSAWLGDEFGVKVLEYGHPDAGWGWAHPMLPADWKRSPSRARAQSAD